MLVAWVVIFVFFGDLDDAIDLNIDLSIDRFEIANLESGTTAKGISKESHDCLSLCEGDLVCGRRG